MLFCAAEHRALVSEWVRKRERMSPFSVLCPHRMSWVRQGYHPVAYMASTLVLMSLCKALVSVTHSPLGESNPSNGPSVSFLDMARCRSMVVGGWALGGGPGGSTHLPEGSWYKPRATSFVFSVERWALLQCTHSLRIFV